MISKITFMKPESTLYHLKNVLRLLEDHYFTIQQLPVMQLIILFDQVVIEDPIQLQAAKLQRARLLMNLGLKDQAQAITQSVESEAYDLTDEEKKVNFEKIKALKDPNDDLVNKIIPFEKEEAGAALLIEQRRIHQSWLTLAEELLRWGHYTRAKTLVMETNLHARILKDQRSYAKSMMLLSTIAYLEGESGSALRLDMLSHKYAQDVEFVEKSMEHTFDILFEYNKINDCRSLLDGCLGMFLQLKQQSQAPKYNDNRKGGTTQKNSQNNLTLEFAISSAYLLNAIFLATEAKGYSNLEEQEPLIQDSFKMIDKFEAQLINVGCNQSHLIKMLRFSNVLQA